MASRLDELLAQEQPTAPAASGQFPNSRLDDLLGGQGVDVRELPGQATSRYRQPSTLEKVGGVAADIALPIGGAVLGGPSGFVGGVMLNKYLQNRYARRTGQMGGEFSPMEPLKAGAEAAVEGAIPGMVALRPGGRVISTALKQAGAQLVGSAAASQIRHPGEMPSVQELAIPAAMAGAGSAVVGGVGKGLTRAGGVGQETAEEVLKRGPKEGWKLAFRYDKMAHDRALDAMRRFAQNPPLTAGGEAMEGLISSAQEAGVRVDVRKLVDRLVNATGVQRKAAVIRPESKIEETVASSILTEQGKPFASRRIRTIPEAREIVSTGPPLAATTEQLSTQGKLEVFAQRLLGEAGPDGKLPIQRANELLSESVTKPTIKAAGKMSPSLEDTAYIRALKKVKLGMLEDISSALGPRGKQAYLSAKVQIKKERTAVENFSKRLFQRDRAGQLHPRDNAIPLLRGMFLKGNKGDTTILKTFEKFDDETGAGVVPWLKELSMKHELSVADKESLVIVDGLVRSASGLRSGGAELARAGSRTVGKFLMVGQRPAGAGIGIMTQEMVEPEEEE